MFQEHALEECSFMDCFGCGVRITRPGIEALKAFDTMEMEGIVPNKITFLGALYACSHAGLVQEGWRVFDTMVHKYSITSMMEHYTCMVDLLARSKHFMSEVRPIIS